MTYNVFGGTLDLLSPIQCYSRWTDNLPPNVRYLTLEHLLRTQLPDHSLSDWSGKLQMENGTFRFWPPVSGCRPL